MLLSLSCSARQHGALSRSKKERTEKQTACLRGGELSPRSLSPANCLQKFTLSVKLHLFWRRGIYRPVAEGPHLCMHGFCLWHTLTITCEHTKGNNNCTVREKNKNKKNIAAYMLIVIICISSSQKFVMWLKGAAIAFSFPQCSTSRKCLFLYLALMWQTVCFVISAKDIKCLFWYKLGGVRLAGRTGERRGGHQGKRDEHPWRVFIRSSCLHLTNSNHNHNNHNLQRAF